MESLKPYGLQFPKFDVPDLDQVFSQVAAAYRDFKPGEIIGQGLASAGNSIARGITGLDKKMEGSAQRQAELDYTKARTAALGDKNALSTAIRPEQVDTSFDRELSQARPLLPLQDTVAPVVVAGTSPAAAAPVVAPVEAMPPVVGLPLSEVPSAVSAITVPVKPVNLLAGKPLSGEVSADSMQDFGGMIPDGKGGFDVPKSSPDYVEWIKGMEGYNPKAYGDSGQTSIGYGTRGKPGEVLDKATADARLREELASHSSRVDQFAKAKGVELTPNQREALISFDFNTGRADRIFDVAVKNGGLDPAVATAKMAEFRHADANAKDGVLDSRRQKEIARFMGQPTAVTVSSRGRPLDEPTQPTPASPSGPIPDGNIKLPNGSIGRILNGKLMSVKDPIDRRPLRAAPGGRVVRVGDGERAPTAAEIAAVTPKVEDGPVFQSPSMKGLLEAADAQGVIPTDITRKPDGTYVAAGARPKEEKKASSDEAGMIFNSNEEIEAYAKANKLIPKEVVAGEDGKLRVKKFEMQELSGGKKLTEGESKSTTYLTRAVDSIRGLGELEKSYNPAGAGALKDRILTSSEWTNFLASDKGQQYGTEQDNFITAILRKDTGAAQTMPEMKQYRRMLFPVPGDSPDTVKLKARKREVALEGLKAGLEDSAIEGIIKGNVAPPEDKGEAKAATVNPANTSISSAVTVTSQAQYDALPSGTWVVDSKGNKGKKP